MDMPDASSPDWEGEIEGLLRHGGVDSRAPHKPLLLLAALSRHAADGRGELTWNEDGPWLDRLLHGSRPSRT
jgi:hypothetical protein